jgi:Protein of unknown function (DUF3108)
MIACSHRAGYAMPGSSARLILSCVGLVIVGVASLLSTPTRAIEAPSSRSADLTYDVYLGALHIFTFDVNMSLQPDRYRVTAEGGTRGLIGFLYRWKMKLAAEGSGDNDRIEPRRYVAETDWQRNPRTLDLRFLGDGRYDLQQVPPPEPDPDIEGGLPEALPEGTVDPLSLAVAASRALAKSGGCDQTVPVFDGRRRFDLIVKHVDETTLAPNAYSVYQGAAVRCSFSMKRISGFRKSWKSSRQWDADSSAPPTIWVAEIRHDLPPVPVRYEGKIALGTIVIHLTKATVR